MRQPRAFLGLGMVAVGAAVMITLAGVSGLAQSPTHHTPESGSLKSVTEFDGIADARTRSQALFTEAAKVITHPRCMNCHPATRSPTQGDDLHPHVPPMRAGDNGAGVAGINCTSCHRSGNTTVPGSRVGSVPGAEPWLLAPASMSWQGRSLGEICRQIKDPTRNGGRSLADIHKHMSTDHLVAWAWHPGEGRRPAPGSQELFGTLINAWIQAGAECPDM